MIYFGAQGAFKKTGIHVIRVDPEGRSAYSASLSVVNGHLDAPSMDFGALRKFLPITVFTRRRRRRILVRCLGNMGQYESYCSPGFLACTSKRFSKYKV